MNKRPALPRDKKLTVIVRVEPGCLGPKGKDHVAEFCRIAQTEVETIDADYVHWEIEPKFDLALAEMQYRVLNKKLTHDMADKYLRAFGKDLDEFESHLHTKLSALIDRYLGH